MASPGVLISYSHDSPEDEGKVLALANRLRSNGIAAVLDQYEIVPPQGWVARRSAVAQGGCERKKD